MYIKNQVFLFINKTYGGVFIPYIVMYIHYVGTNAPVL